MPCKGIILIYYVLLDKRFSCFQRNYRTMNDLKGGAPH